MHEHDRGLPHDLLQLQRGLTRRRLALGTLAGAGGLMAGAGGLMAGAMLPLRAAAQAGACTVIPTETAGPFPGNGSGRGGGAATNALALSGIVRSDIRSSIGGASGVAAGVPLKLTLKLVNAASSCVALAGHAIYIWQCDRDGRYSMYSQGVPDENYLRGVQSTDSQGNASFTSIFPACYPGRMPHLHFEVYRSLDAASSSANRLKTSQLALPPEVCAGVYARAPGYAASALEFARITFDTDGVFRDGVGTQLATVAGSIEAGFTATLTVGISA